MNHSMIADEMAVFARVVELNGFTAAARKLLVPKVRVSRAVAALERELGTRLLERTTRRISLTPAGRSILAHCQRVALEVEAARAALQPVAQGEQLRVAIDQGFGRLLVAPLVPRFLERFPQVTLRLINADEIADGAAFDVELRSDGRKADGEVQSSLGTPPMILCAAPNYLAGKELPQTPSELGQHSLLWAGGGPEANLRLAKDGGAVVVPRHTATGGAGPHGTARRRGSGPGDRRAAGIPLPQWPGDEAADARCCRTGKWPTRWN